jgi:stearoyl-CoA desaturase (Delta-9 desaturase)
MGQEGAKTKSGLLSHFPQEYDERVGAYRMGHLIWFYLLIGIVVSEFASLLTTVYLHRASTHRSVIFHPVLEFFMQFGLWLTTGINRKEWVAVHLCHHAHADEEGDPHSPRLLGLWRVQIGNLFLYIRAARDPKVLWYGRNIVPTLAERTIFKSTYLGLLVGIGLLWLMFGFWPMLIVVGMHMFLYLFFLNNLINGWCHVKGYKNFPQAVAYNNRFIALITMGEGLHNNHHHKPGSASLSYKTSEVDPGWLFIRLARLCGLARLA